MPVMKLSARTVEGLKPRPERYEVWDDGDDGLGIRVEASGRMTWMVRYRSRGLRRRLKIGTFPKTGLKVARDRAKKALGRVEGGADPAAERKEMRTANTLSELVRLYVQDPSGERAQRTTDDYERTRVAVLGKGTMGATLADEVRRADLKTWLSAMAKDKPVRANRVLALIRAAYRWGLREGLVKVDPTSGGFRRPARETPRERVLTDDEVRKVWLAVDGLGLVVAGAIKIMLLAGTRRSETLTMRWTDLDLAVEKVWRIPGSARKGGRALSVPLAPVAVKILEGLHPATGDGVYVFAGPKGASINANPSRWCSKLEETTGVAFTLHDLRRSCATGCATLGAAPHVISLILGHKLLAGSLAITRLVYDRADRLGEIREALTSWATHVTKVVAGKPKRSTRHR